MKRKLGAFLLLTLLVVPAAAWAKGPVVSGPSNLSAIELLRLSVDFAGHLMY